MKQKKQNNRRKRNREDKFKPNQAFIDQAREDYLKRGGRITRIEILPDFFEDCFSYADEFLMEYA